MTSVWSCICFLTAVKFIGSVPPHKVGELLSSIVNVGGGHWWNDLDSQESSILRAECETAA